MKKLGSKMLQIIIVAIVLLQSTMVFAASESALKNQQSENNKKINEAEENLDEVQAKKSETVKQIEELSNEISDYQSQIATLENQISELNTKIGEAEKQLEKAQEDYTKQEELLEARLVATYEAGETSYLDFLLSSDSITDLISNYYLVSEVAANDAELLDKIQKQKEDIEAAKNTLEVSKRDLDTSKASKQSVATQLQTAKKEKDAQVAKLSEEEKAIQEEIDSLREANVQIAAEIKKAQEQYKAQIEALDKNNGSYNSGGSGVLQSPVNTGVITATMYYSNGTYHGALDYGIPVGTPVYASAAGVVIKTANLTSSYGTYVVIQHANGLQTWYAHGEYGSICVSPGQTVSRGQQIMRSGNTGKSTGPHLHFEVRVSPYDYSTCRVDPRNYF